MRSWIRLAFSAAFVCVALAARADDAKPSTQACDSRKIGARELADCLHQTADKSDRELTETLQAALKTIDTRIGLMSAQKARWKRSLNEAEAQWITWRDSECQDVAPFEAGMGSRGGDPRAACLIDQNAKRIADLKARYP